MDWTTDEAQRQWREHELPRLHEELAQLAMHRRYTPMEARERDAMREGVQQ